VIYAVECYFSVTKYSTNCSFIIKCQ